MADAYKKGAVSAGFEVKEIIIRELDFNPNLAFGYRKRTELEPDLLTAQQKVLWAEHLVIFYPVWWGGVPAILKGFFDRAFIAGFGYKPNPNTIWSWDKLLKGKTARIACTLDQPAWVYRLLFRSPSHHAIKRSTLKFCGISPVKISTIGPIKLSKPGFRKKWLVKIEKLGQRAK